MKSPNFHAVLDVYKDLLKENERDIEEAILALRGFVNEQKESYQTSEKTTGGATVVEFVLHDVTPANLARLILFHIEYLKQLGMQMELLALPIRLLSAVDPDQVDKTYHIFNQTNQELMHLSKIMSNIVDQNRDRIPDEVRAEINNGQLMSKDMREKRNMIISMVKKADEINELMQ